jgi:hypothetical protein
MVIGINANRNCACGGVDGCRRASAAGMKAFIPLFCRARKTVFAAQARG